MCPYYHFLNQRFDFHYTCLFYKGLCTREVWEFNIKGTCNWKHFYHFPINNGLCPFYHFLAGIFSIDKCSICAQLSITESLRLLVAAG